MEYPLAFTETVRELGDLEGTQLRIQPHCGLVVKSPETYKSGLGAKGGRDDCPMCRFEISKGRSDLDSQVGEDIKPEVFTPISYDVYNIYVVRGRLMHSFEKFIFEGLYPFQSLITVDSPWVCRSTTEHYNLLREGKIAFFLHSSVIWYNPFFNIIFLT